MALEKANSVNARLQITLLRIQLQQNQVNRISSDLESVRSAISRAETDEAQTSDELSGIENRLQQEQDPNRQKQLQDNLKYVKPKSEQESHIAQDLRGKKSELVSSLQREQAKLADLQSR